MMGQITDKTSESDDEAKGLDRPEPPGLHWGWLVVASGFYCVTIVGGVGEIMIMITVIITVMLLLAGNSHRDPHGKPQTGFGTRKHSNHFTFRGGSGIHFFDIRKNCQNVASDILFAFYGTHCQHADDQTRRSPCVYVRGDNCNRGAPGSQLCQQHPSPHYLLFCPDWTWSWPDLHPVHCGLCPLLHQKQVTSTQFTLRSSIHFSTTMNW